MKKIMFVVIALIMGCACTAHAQKGFSAPLGLSWGESKEKIIKKYGGVPAKKNEGRLKSGNDSNLLIMFYVQIMSNDFVMQFHRF